MYGEARRYVCNLGRVEELRSVAWGHQFEFKGCSARNRSGTAGRSTAPCRRMWCPTRPGSLDAVPPPPDCALHTMGAVGGCGVLTQSTHHALAPCCSRRLSTQLYLIPPRGGDELVACCYSATQWNMDSRSRNNNRYQSRLWRHQSPIHGGPAPACRRQVPDCTKRLVQIHRRGH